MQDPKTTKSKGQVVDSDTTSEETLEEVEKSEEVKDSESAEERGILAPDGADDESVKSDDAGPM